MKFRLQHPAGAQSSNAPWNPRSLVSAALVVIVSLTLTACMPPAIEDFVYSRAAHRVQSVGEYLGRIFAEQSNVLAMSEKVQGDTASEGRQARLWDPSESNSSYGGNWITSFHQGQTATEVSADVLITIPGSRSGGIFSSESADVLLCIRYLGAVGSDDVHVVDADCPEGVEANLPSFQRVSVDQLTDYEVGE